METADNDIILFDRIKDDDRLALNELFFSYYTRLCSFANTYLHHTGEAEEVVSDVFFAIWKNRHNLEIERSLRSYLFTSVKNGCIAALRMQHPELQSDHEVLALLEIIDLSNPESEIEYQELRQHLDKSVGLRYKEISSILGISEKTVENQLVKALTVIRHSIRQFQSDGDSIRTVNS
jgi:RNA polymerase sigma-70 factor (ECF subfamily)